MTEAIKFVPPRVPLTDPDTGTITREWYLFLQGVFFRIGGSTGASIPDVSASMFEDAGSGETNSLLFNFQQSSSQSPPYPDLQQVVDALENQVAQQREQLAEVVKELQAIKQGTLI
jgi:hypothetical protein